MKKVTENNYYRYDIIKIWVLIRVIIDHYLSWEYKLRDIHKWIMWNLKEIIPGTPITK